MKTYRDRREPADLVIATIIVELEEGGAEDQLLAMVLYRFLDGRVLGRAFSAVGHR